MKAINFTAALVMAAFSYSASAQQSEECATKKIETSIEAFGGRQVLDSLHSLKLKGLGYRLMREQSERPEGPYLTDYFSIETEKDLDRKMLKTTWHSNSFDYSISYLLNDSLAARSFNGNGHWYPAPKVVENQYFLAPERVLFTALKAADLHCGKDTIIQKVPHSIISFTWRNKPVKVFLNKNTQLITAVQTTEEYQLDNYHVWGDVPQTIYYSFYGLEKNKFRYPYQMDIFINGELSENITLTSLEQNPGIADTLEINKELLPQISAYYHRKSVGKLAADKAFEEEKDLTVIPGSWNCSIVKQEDGIIVIEAPVSSGFSSEIIDLAHQLYPSEKIKAVVNTSPAWPHIGGLRAFVAEDIPVYYAEGNLPLLQKLMKAEFKTHPDKQEKLQKPIISKAVSEKTKIGKGKNRMIIYPIRTEGSEGMLMIYFPEYKLLYTSDMVQGISSEGTPYFKEYWLEILQAIDREQLEVEKIFGMHQLPVKLSELKKALSPDNAPSSCSSL